MTIMAPEAVGETLDPRDPLLRLRTFFDDDSVELLHERDRSGVLAAAGTVNGLRTIAFCTDGTVMGTYLHGVFAADAFRRNFIGSAAATSALNYEARVDATLDALAAHLEAHLDLDHLLSLAR